MNILITRPSPAGEQLVKRLLDIGKYAYHLPIIRFSSGRNLPLLKKKLNLLSEGDFLFVVSQRAIEYAHYQLLNIGMPWPTKLVYYSIGYTTSLKLFMLSGILSQYPHDIETSENLLKIPELMYCYGRRALILRGNNGRTVLENTLRRRGVKVAYCECYMRHILQYNGEEQCHRMITLNINVVVVTTEEILKQLYYLIPLYYRKSWLIRCRLIVISCRLAIIAKSLGWTDVIVAYSANNDTLIRVIIQNS